MGQWHWVIWCVLEEHVKDNLCKASYSKPIHSAEKQFYSLLDVKF